CAVLRCRLSSSGVHRAVACLASTAPAPTVSSPLSLHDALPISVVAEGDRLARGFRLLLLHALTSTQRCSSAVRGPRGGLPWAQASSPTSRPLALRRSRR